MAIVNKRWMLLSEDPYYVTAMREASYEAYVDPYRGMMLTDYFQSSEGVGPSASAAAITAVADTTHADAHASKDINRGRMNQHNAQEEDIEEDERSEKQALKDQNLCAAKGGVLREEEETPLFRGHVATLIEVPHW